MNSKEPEWLSRVIEEVCGEQGVSVVAFRRMLAKVEEYSEKAHASGVHEELLEILREGDEGRGAMGEGEGSPKGEILQQGNEGNEGPCGGPATGSSKFEVGREDHAGQRPYPGEWAGAEVFIDSLTIENFGPYYGIHVFQFTPLEGRASFFLGGRNGTGKSHLLRGLYLAVVGESGPSDLRKLEAETQATGFNFEKCLNRKAADQGAKSVRLTVVLRRVEGGSVRTLKLVREITFRRHSRPTWVSSAQLDGGPEEIRDEQVIQQLRESFLPRHLAQFFFFDAESSQSLHLGQAEVVEGVSRILGLRRFEKLDEDLRWLIQRKLPKLYSAPGAAQAATRLADLSAEVVRAEGHLAAKRKEQEALEAEGREIEAELAQVEAQLGELGSGDPAELERVRQRQTELLEEKAGLRAQITEAFEETIPLGLLGGYAGEFYGKLAAEEKRRDWESKKAAVEPKLPEIQQRVFEGTPAKLALSAEAKAFYNDRLRAALQELLLPPAEGMTAGAPYIAPNNEVSARVRARLMAAVGPLRRFQETVANLERVNAELEEVERRLEEFQSEPAQAQRGVELRGRKEELNARREQLKGRREQLGVEIGRLEKELAGLKGQEAEQREVAERAEQGQSLAARGMRFREAAGTIQERAAEHLRKEIGAVAGELWVEITGREREFSGMEFDRQWNCVLVRRDGRKVPWEEINLSAGQRQVRMLAFYEALRRMARLVPPLVVDTPLARLDKEVRESVLQRLYLNGHQSILLTTNAEIDPEGPLFEQVKGRLARVYTLEPQGEAESTDYLVRVTGDYFGREL